MSQAFGAGPFAPLEDQVRRNMEMFEKAFTMFAPFARREAQAGKGDQAAETEKPAAPAGGEIDDLKRQLDDVQKRLHPLSEKKGSPGRGTIPDPAANLAALPPHPEP